MKLRVMYRSSEKREAKRLIRSLVKFLEKKGYNVSVSKEYRGQKPNFMVV